jgi:peroxiredoxin
MSATVMYEDRVAVAQSALEDGAHLWLSVVDMESVTGWTLKPEGLCRAEACVALPGDGSWVDGEGRVDLAAFAARFDRPVARDAEHSVWAFGDPVNGRAQQLESLQAPDFTLPDLDGRLHSLSDFRGKKIFLMAWGSYCGCRLDLPVWQVLYDELKDQNFELVSVALDAGGRAAVEPSIRCTNLAERPDALRTALGWSEDDWRHTAAPSYTCVIDEEHQVADLYGIKNVPEAVWIDENGQIVRPAEPAGLGYQPGQTGLSEDEIARLAANRRTYWDAIRDWVKVGSQSRFALTQEQIRARLRRPSAADARAAAHARIGRHLFGQGENDAAKCQFEEAARLCPQKWNYRRQSMVLEPELIGEINIQSGFWEAIANLDGEAYYDPIDMPGMRPDPSRSDRPQS